MTAQHTHGALQVRMDGTLTGIWAEIGEVCIDPATNKEWWRELARTSTTHVRRADCYDHLGEFADHPEEYQLEPEGLEFIANAHLWAASQDLLEAARSVVMAMSGRVHSRDALRAIAACKAAITKATGEKL